MKPGGRIRISCPALDIYIRHYANDDHDYFRKVYQAGRSFEGLATPGQVLMGQIQGWGHRWVYDHEGMEQELIRAGFRGFQRSSFRQGDFPDLIDLEPDGDARTIQSMYVEAAR